MFIKILLIFPGTFWSAFVHAFTAAIGSAILALPWSLAQLGWIVGTSVLIIFPLISYYTSSKLCDCYRAPDPVLGTRNNTYMDAVKSLLGTHIFCLSRFEFD